MTDAPRKVSIWDLTGDQTEALELELGKPIDQWTSDLPSRARVLIAIYSTVTGIDRATAGALSLRELMDAVSIAGDEGDAEDAETENPT